MRGGTYTFEARSRFAWLGTCPMDQLVLMGRQSKGNPAQHTLMINRLPPSVEPVVPEFRNKNWVT